MNMKNKLLSIYTIIVVAFCSLFFFIACENDDLDTNILGSNKTTLVAYGPNPALRGQKLSFAGTNLDKITKVILPNNIEITDIEVVSDKLIKVLIPQETVEGMVKLIGPNNLELTSQDTLFISEPISITKMSPQPVKAGQVLTIEGDYFNLVTKVIFTDKVEVLAKDCKVWERTKIELVLPAEAAPGVVTLSDDAEIPLEYQSPEPLDVVLPSVNAVLDLTGKKPGEAITAPGKDLDLVVRVEMPNGDEVPFTIDNSALKFTLPENISDGAIVMIPASEIKVVVANIGVAIPAEIVVTPNKGLRAGDEITIKGINMELVKSVSFPGVDTAVEPSSKSAVEIKVTMPDKAITGEIVLNTASGKTVTAAIETLKPNVVSYNPSAASAGSDVKLQGHNLDLAISVTFADNLVVAVTPGAADELVVNIPLNAVSGVVVLTMANGETVTCSELEINPPVFAFLPNPPGPKAEIHANGVLTLEVANGNKLTDVQINGASVKYILNNPSLYVVIPGNAKGNTELKLISSNGEAVYIIPVIGAGIVETTVWEGIQELSWNAYAIPKANFGDPLSGSRLRFYYRATGSAPKLKLYYGDWGGPITIDDPNFDTAEGLLLLPEGESYYDVVLTAEMIHGIMNPSGGSDGMLLMGDGAILSKISIITGSEPEITTLWTGSVGPIGWSGGDLVGPVDTDLLAPGKTLGIDFECDASAGYWQMEVMAGSWWTDLEGWLAFTGGNRQKDFAQSDTNIELVITQTDINNIKEQGSALLICGNGIIIKKLYVKD